MCVLLLRCNSSSWPPRPAEIVCHVNISEKGVGSRGKRKQLGRGGAEDGRGHKENRLNKYATEETNIVR